ERAALVARLTPVAERIGLAGRLDLDDLRAHVTEQPGGERPSEEHPELDHPHARKRADALGLATRLRGDRGVGHWAGSGSRRSGLARRCPTRTSRASNTCSFMT